MNSLGVFVSPHPLFEQDAAAFPTYLGALKPVPDEFFFVKCGLVLLCATMGTLMLTAQIALRNARKPSERSRKGLGGKSS